MAIRHVALRYMTGFQCLGSACEDNCCHDWSVSVDRRHYGEIKRAMSADPIEKERFARAFTLAPANRRTRDSFALVTLDGDARCLLLDGGLCSLQSRHGEALLPDACAIYPRVLAAAGERHELSGELSCPELARRCLIAADGTELIECAPSLAGRAVVGQRSSDGDLPYLRFNGAIRGALYRLLSRPGYRIDERLFFVACFAQETSEFFTRETMRLDGARLTEQLRLLEDDVALAGLRAHFATLTGAPSLVTQVLAQMLAAWLGEHCAPRFREIVRAALESLAGGADGGESMQVDAEWMSRAFEARKAEREATVSARLDQIVSNYCKHFIVRHWYTDAPDLVAYVQQLLLRVATARLLIYCQPRLATEPDIDAAAVAVVYSLTRALEHNAGLVRGVTELLRDKLPSLAHAVALLKL
jgi:lysine-N-methylase